MRGTCTKGDATRDSTHTVARPLARAVPHVVTVDRQDKALPHRQGWAPGGRPVARLRLSGYVGRSVETWSTASPLAGWYTTWKNPHDGSVGARHGAASSRFRSRL